MRCVVYTLRTTACPMSDDEFDELEGYIIIWDSSRENVPSRK